MAASRSCPIRGSVQQSQQARPDAVVVIVAEVVGQVVGCLEIQERELSWRTGPNERNRNCNRDCLPSAFLDLSAASLWGYDGDHLRTPVCELCRSPHAARSVSFGGYITQAFVVTLVSAALLYYLFKLDLSA